MLQVWAIKLTESTNVCWYGICDKVSDMVSCAIKLNIKKSVMGNDGFLQQLMW